MIICLYNSNDPYTMNSKNAIIRFYYLFRSNYPFKNDDFLDLLADRPERGKCCFGTVPNGVPRGPLYDPSWIECPVLG